MGRSVRGLILIIVLSGCGGTRSTPAGFVNHTQHSTSDLWVIWNTAQHRVARQVDLNPLQRSLYDAPARLLPGDGRALGLQPRMVRVAPAADVPSGTLLTDTGIYRQDPTGMIACPQPCNVHYAAAYSRYQTPLVKYAASWEFQGQNFARILEYEFESQILCALGYDVQWR